MTGSWKVGLGCKKPTTYTCMCRGAILCSIFKEILHGIISYENFLHEQWMISLPDTGHLTGTSCCKCMEHIFESQHKCPVPLFMDIGHCMRKSLNTFYPMLQFSAAYVTCCFVWRRSIVQPFFYFRACTGAEVRFPLPVFTLLKSPCKGFTVHYLVFFDGS